MHQYQVIKHITLTLGSMLEASLAETLGKAGEKIRVVYEYSPDLKKAPGAVSICNIGLVGRGGNTDREYERDGQGREVYRNAPLLLRAGYLVSAWAPAPDDQELMGLVLRTFHDNHELQTEGDAEQTVSYEGRPTLELEALPFERHKELCGLLGMPLAPSVAYWTNFVIQSATTQTIKRVRERVMDFKKIDG
jgi:hypothetical protein